jgi:TRAP-type C4-dicarboxylate transport system permease small subunit
MRRLLDAVYLGSGILAAAFLALIALLVLAQMAGRLVGVLVPGTDDLASFSLTATSFLALAYTFRSGGHIRVTLLVRKAAPAARRRLELGCLGVGTAIVGYFAGHVVEMVIDSYRFGEMSTGVLPVPLWIPQSSMAVGALVLFVALVDEIVHVARRGVPSYPDETHAAAPAPGDAARPRSG